MEQGPPSCGIQVGMKHEKMSPRVKSLFDRLDDFHVDFNAQFAALNQKLEEDKKAHVMAIKEMDARVKSQVENQRTAFEELILEKLGNIEGELKSTRLSNEKSHEGYAKRLERMEETMKKIETRLEARVGKLDKRVEELVQNANERCQNENWKLDVNVTSLKNLGDKLAHIEQTLCSKPEKA